MPTENIFYVTQSYVQCSLYHKLYLALHTFSYFCLCICIYENTTNGIIFSCDYIIIHNNV